MFHRSEEDQAERHDQGTIDDVLGDQDLEQGKGVLEEADRDADLLEHIPLLGHSTSEKERLASWFRLLRRARVAIRRSHRNLRHLNQRSTCADARSCSSTTTLHQSSKNVSMSGLRQHKAETSNTQSITTSTSNVQSRTLGSLSFHECLRAFVHGWTRWAGWPGPYRCDRGTRNRGASSSIHTKNGVTIRPAGLEAPEQIRRVER